MPFIGGQPLPPPHMPWSHAPPPFRWQTSRGFRCLRYFSAHTQAVEPSEVAYAIKTGGTIPFYERANIEISSKSFDRPRFISNAKCQENFHNNWHFPKSNTRLAVSKCKLIRHFVRVYTWSIQPHHLMLSHNFENSLNSTCESFITVSYLWKCRRPIWFKLLILF